MSLLRDLHSDLLGEALAFLRVRELACVARAHRSFATEIDKQQWIWQHMCQRDWNISADSAGPKPTTPAPEAAAVGAAAMDDESDAAAKAAEAASAASASPEAVSPNPPATPAPAFAEITKRSDESWQQLYRRLAAHFGPTTHCYSRIEPVWRRLRHWIREHADQLPPILQTLPPTFPEATDPLNFTRTARAGPPLPPSLSWEEASVLIAQAQIEWVAFQQHIRKTIRKEIEAEGGGGRAEAESKRESKRASHANTNTAAAGAAAAASAATSAASSNSAAAPATDDASMDFLAAVGLEPLEQPAAAAATAEGEPLSQLEVDTDLLCALLLHNGQSPATRMSHLYESLFGFFAFYDATYTSRLLDLETLLDTAVERSKALIQIQIQREKQKRRAAKRRKSETNVGEAAATTAAAASTAATSASSSDADAPFSIDCDLLLPFGFSPNGHGDHYLLVRTGQVIRICSDASYHVVCDSFFAFFARWVNDLERGMFRFQANTGINRYPLLHETGSVCTTRGICIRSCVLFVPEQSRPHSGMGLQGPFLFTYHIEITHDGSTNVRAQLVSRHWEIRDDTGNVDVVDGPGVIGLTPRVFPGCPLFSYESCSNLATRRGVMQGFFRFRVENGAHEEEFDAIIKPFILDADKNYC